MDPITLALIGLGVGAGGGLLAGLSKIFGGKRQAEALSDPLYEQKKAIVEQLMKTRYESSLPELSTLQAQIGSTWDEAMRSVQAIQGLSQPMVAQIMGLIPQAQTGILGMIPQMQQNIQQAYSPALALAQQLAQQETSRQLDVVGLGGTGAGTLLAQRMTQQMTLPLLQEQAGMSARGTLGLTELAGHTIADLTGTAGRGIVGLTELTGREIGDVAKMKAGTLSQLPFMYEKMRQEAFLTSLEPSRMVLGAKTRKVSPPSFWESLFGGLASMFGGAMGGLSAGAMVGGNLPPAGGGGGLPGPEEMSGTYMTSYA